MARLELIAIIISLIGVGTLDQLKTKDRPKDGRTDLSLVPLTVWLEPRTGSYGATSDQRRRAEGKHDVGKSHMKRIFSQVHILSRKLHRVQKIVASYEKKETRPNVDYTSKGW